MKKLAVWLLSLTTVFSLASCAGQKEAESFPPFSQSESAVLSGTVASLEEGFFLLACDDSGSSDLFTVPYCGTELQRGQKVTVTYSGMIEETYPGRPVDVTGVTVTGEGSDLIGLYLEVLESLYGEDDALNSGISLIAFDFTGLSNLSSAEKFALGYLFSGQKHLEPLFATMNELEEQGYVNDLYFKNGIVLSISTGETDPEKDFTFSASKWRSGLGAIGVNDCSASLSGRKWSYKAGGFWIS